MNAADLLGLLLETTLATSAAVIVVLLARRPLRQASGPGVAYAAWLMVPAALVAVLLPAREAATQLLPMIAIIPVADAIAVPIEAASFDFMPMLVATWAAGTMAMGLRLLLQQRAFARALGPLRRREDGSHQAATVIGLPAAIGLLRPRIVVPADFDDRYSVDQRALMQLHERTHIRRGDLHLNALAALLRCVYWFNPLIHLAARHFRHDQELACDQHVIERHPHRRRAYGEAMLHTQLASQPLPLGCHWGFSHPLRERIEMLKQNPKSGTRIVTGAVLVAALAIATGAAAWAVQPTQPVEVISTKPSADNESRYLNPPRYPADAAANNVSGKVVLIVDIDAEGKPTHVEVEKSDPAGVFDDNAIAAAYKWHFTPEVMDGKPVPSRVRVPVDFQADGSSSSREHTPAPKYPAGAAKEKIGGRVVLLLDVDAQGRVTGVEVENSEPAGVFDQVTIEAARTWTFNPANENGVPVPSRVRVPVDFAPDAPAAEVPTVNMMPAAPGQS